MRNRSFDKLIALSLVLLIVLSCLSLQVPQVKADTYNQIPLWINIMEGADISDEQIDDIEKEIDDIWKANGLNWRVTSVVLDEEYGDPDKEQDNPGDVRVGEGTDTPEEKPLWGAGKNETDDKSGFKIFVVNRILNETGHDTNTTGVSWEAYRTAIVAEPSYADPPVGGDTWAHEIGHLFGLLHEKQNGTDRPTDDLMYPYRDDRTDTDLQGEDIGTMNKTKTEEDLGIPTLTDEQRGGGTNYQMYRSMGEDARGDSTYNFTDIQDVYFAFYILNETRELHITTYLGGVIPIGVGLTYSVALDNDNDLATGGDFIGWQGIDFLIDVNATSPDVVEGFLYSYPGLVPITPLETRIETHFKVICRTAPPAPPPLATNDSIVINLPLEFMNLSDPIRVGTLMESMGTDKLEIMSLSTSPPERPSLTFEPPVAPPGTVVTATGGGFTPTNSVSIIFDHINLSTAEVGPDGSFQTNFTVPELPADHYMVDAIDDSHQVAVNMFTITAPPVGGIFIPVDKLALLAPYIGLALTIVVVTVIYAKRFKRRNKKQ